MGIMSKNKSGVNKLGVIGLSVAMGLGVVAVAPAAAMDNHDGEHAQDGLPSGAELMKKFIDATGGEEAIKKIKSRKSVGTFAMPAMGIEASLEMVNSAPDKMRMVIEVPGFGTETNGTDGEVSWAVSTTNGPRVLEGEEATAMEQQADMHAPLHWEDIYESVTTVGEEDVEGTPAYVVELVNKKTGRTETRLYAKDSGLLLQLRQKQMTAMGEMPSITTMSDYRDVDGLKMPFKMVISAGQMEQVVTMTSIEHNIEVDNGVFGPPEEVQALIDG